MSKQINIWITFILGMLMIAFVPRVTNAKPIKYHAALKQELFIAIENGNCQKVKRVLACCDSLLMSKNEEGLTPLMFATQNNQQAIVRLLKKHEKLLLQNQLCDNGKKN